MAIDISIIFTPHWERLAKHLKIDHYDKDGGHVDPRIRIGFVELPEAWAKELVMFTMPCVACQRPSHPLRRREGDPWERLFYAPTCPLASRIACSRSRAAELEYERFKAMPLVVRPSAQLELLV